MVMIGPLGRPFEHSRNTSLLMCSTSQGYAT
ncbi:hypothetical protein RSOL_208130 [Rhizoctonia solani AG-3 Rhs1AP]|uniref:Uncharacterized protein n=1 Tax=Rhizoctonia solani AG-3 Rhs1AP TaxID=1086054 RepID=X8J461_9AGAM|nr:hypothetical protein RSOL_208130 [Rhizoctonia solani AG-3 Rhs1AP]